MTRSWNRNSCVSTFSPNRHRYALVDPGVDSAGGSPPPSRTDSLDDARPAGRPPGQPTGSMPSPALLGHGRGSRVGKGRHRCPPTVPGWQGPDDVCRNGFSGVKLEEEVCVITFSFLFIEPLFFLVELLVLIAMILFSLRDVDGLCYLLDLIAR